MSIVNEINKRTQALREILGSCNSALGAKGMEAALDLSALAARIGGICNLRIITGSFTPEADSTSLSVPVSGFPKAVSIAQADGAYTDGTFVGACFDSFSWRETLGGYNSLLLYHSSFTRMSMANATFSEDAVSFPALSDSFVWKGGTAYAWTAYYWDELPELLAKMPMGEEVIVDGMTYYGSDLSAAVAGFEAGETVRVCLIPTGAGGYRAAVVGTGATEDFTYADEHPWDEYAEQITELFVAEGITAIGNAFFCRLSKAKKFVNRSTTLTAIGDFAFYRCFALGSALGLDRVQSVGAHAFQSCAALDETDLDGTVCGNVGDFAAHMSSVEDSAALAAWAHTAFGLCANRALKWGDALAEIQNTKYSATKILSCPNAESQGKYPDIPFCSGISSAGARKVAYVRVGGCVGLTLYHAYNAIHANDGLARESFEDFWYNVLKAEEKTSVQHFVEQGLIDPALIYANGTDASGGYVDGVALMDGELCFSLRNFHGGTDEHEILGEMLRRLGWKMSDRHRTYGAEQKQLIDASLQAGIPVLASVNHHELNEDYAEGEHEICIIGCDAATGKLTVVDSIGAAGDAGHIYTVAYEDLFYSYETAEGKLTNSIHLLSV